MLSEDQKILSGVEEWTKYWEGREMFHPTGEWQTAVSVKDFKVTMKKPHEKGSNLSEKYIVILPFLGRCIHTYNHPDYCRSQTQECSIYDVKRCPIVQKAIDLFLVELKEYRNISIDVKYRQIRSFFSNLKIDSSKLPNLFT